MINKIFFYTIIFLSVGINAKAQDHFFGLFSDSYLQPIGTSDKAVRIKKHIYIVYNTTFCLFFVEGKGPVFFKTRGYRVSLQGEYTHTDFVSEETNTTPDGYYGIMIDKGKNDNIFQVNLPNGFTYVVTNAKGYVQGAQINNNPYTKQFQSFRDSTNRK